MKNIKTGIYKITNILNNKIYIGSSKDIQTRWRKHISLLKSTKHSNTHLQNAWIKYGENAFIIEVIEICPLYKQIILEREQYYIDTLKPEYNKCPKAGSSLGRSHSNETKEKIKLALKEKPWSDERRKASDNISKKLSLIKEMKQWVKDLKKIKKDFDKVSKKIIKLENKKKINVNKKTKSLSEAMFKNKNRLGKIHTEESKLKMSLAKKGKPRSEETKIKISQTLKERSDGAVPS
jgi:group I intron endonuclease